MTDLTDLTNTPKHTPLMIANPYITCGACKLSWSMHGVIDMNDTKFDWRCPWCGKSLSVVKTTEPNTED